MHRILGLIIFLLGAHCSNSGTAVPDLGMSAADLRATPDDLTSTPGDMAGPTSSPRVCSPGGWCWENQLPVGNDLSSIWAADANNVWIASRTRSLLKWNGANWLADYPSSTSSTLAVFGTSSTNVWAVGTSGMIL